MKYLVNLDLSQNELQNAKIQNLAAAPGNPVAGQIYFNTASNKYFGYNGTKWVDLGFEHPSTHTIAQISGLQSALDGKASSGHNHDSAYKPANYVPAWGEVTGKPSTFTPAAHTHNEYVNQNAFSNVKVGSTTVAADSATDTLEIAAGANITITPDATNDKITIAANVPAHPSGLHVTQQEKDTWNAKETTTGAQAKADKALNDAKAYANQKVANLVGSAPEALDTLQELAEAVQGNQAGVTDLLQQVGTKASTSYVNEQLATKAASNHNHDSVYAKTSHNHNSGQITAMTGYAKPTSTSAISTSDSLNAAIGKLEKALDGKQASGSYAAANHNHDTAYLGKTATAAAATKLATARTINGVAFDGTGNITITANPNAHNQASNTITAMTGYAKASAAAAIADTDSLNVAIGKLEKALDGKQAAGSYAPASHTSDTTLHITASERNAWNAKSNLALGTTSSTAFRGDQGLTAYNHSQAAHAPANAQKNSDITKAEIEAKLTGNITTHTHNYAASNHNHNGVYTRKYAANIGDGSKTTINVAHNLGSEDVTVAVREVASKQLVMADVQIVDSNNIQILFASAPASNSYRVVVIG